MNLRFVAYCLSLMVSLAAPALAAESKPVTKVAPKATAAAVARVNINTADANGLLTLKGVGSKKAQAIVAYRKAHGPFNSLEQFEAVPGIGPSIIAKNRNIIVFR